MGFMTWCDRWDLNLYGIGYTKPFSEVTVINLSSFGFSRASKPSDNLLILMHLLRECMLIDIF